MKKFLLSALSVVTVAALAITGTIAWLQDDDSDVNVMTLGNVSIEQIEQEWNAGETALQDFTQAKPLYPYVGNLGWENTTDNGGAYRRFTMNNVVDKYVSVKNTGKSDAYVRTIIALEMGDFSYTDLGKIIGASVNHYNGSEFQFPGAWDWTDDFVAEIDGKNYNIMVAVHKDAIEPGETTIPSLLQVYMNKDATNEDCEKIDGNGNGTYDILVFSQAVQTAGFADAETALDAAFGDITTTNHPWAGAGNAPVVPVVVSDAAELNAAIAAGGSAVLSEDVEMEAATTAPYGNKYGVALNGGVLDGNGNELKIECYGDDYGIMTTGGTVKNLTIKEGCRAVMIMYATEDIILDNVNIGGDGVLYPINTGETGPNGSAGIDLIVTNSTIKGWTSYGDAIESASFTNVSFGQGTYYSDIYGRVLKPYVNTTLTDCSFIEHMNLDLSALKEGHKVTIENCTVNGQAVTADVFTIPSTDAEYDTELFTVDLPSWATSISDCIIFK